jgi:hypothetical protein
VRGGCNDDSPYATEEAEDEYMACEVVGSGSTTVKDALRGNLLWLNTGIAESIRKDLSPTSIYMASFQEAIVAADSVG